MNKEIFIDATGGTLGRIASFAAKQALLGKTVKILNCNEALITGKMSTVLEKYKRARSRGGASMKGPKFPKSPERIMKRTVRGMLSHKQGRGADAFKRIMCYNGTPGEFKDKELISMKRELKARPVKLSVLSERL